MRKEFDESMQQFVPPPPSCPRFTVKHLNSFGLFTFAPLEQVEGPAGNDSAPLRRQVPWAKARLLGYVSPFSHSLTRSCSMSFS